MEQLDRQRREVLRATGRGKQSVIPYGIFHFLVRIVSLTNALSLLLDVIAPEYRIPALLHLSPRLYLISSLILPLYVAVERWWMRGSKLEMRAVLVDAAFAVGWFLVFFGLLTFTFYRNGFPWL
jgi:hypothetical protein